MGQPGSNWGSGHQDPGGEVFHSWAEEGEVCGAHLMFMCGEALDPSLHSGISFRTCKPGAVTLPALLLTRLLCLLLVLAWFTIAAWLCTPCPFLFMACPGVPRPRCEPQPHPFHPSMHIFPLPGFVLVLGSC